MAKYIDFAHINANADFPAILAHYNLEYTRQGDQIRMICPFHEDTKPSLSITLVADGDAKANTFHCFGCNVSGGPIKFVELYEGLADDPRAAALIVDEICGCGLSGGKRKRRKGPEKPGAGRRASNKEKAAPTAENGGSGHSGEAEAISGGNPPLGYELQGTITDHPYLVERVDEATIALFGVAYVSAERRGMFANRLVIPLHDLSGELVGYQGRYPGDQIPDDTEKYLLPPKFQKQHFLFNAHRLDDTADVVLVEGAFAAMRLHQLGAPVVATLGTAISEHHVEQLRSLGIRRVVLMFDADEPGRKALPAALMALAPSFFVTVASLSDGSDPEDVDESELQALAEACDELFK